MISNNCGSVTTYDFSGCSRSGELDPLLLVNQLKVFRSSEVSRTSLILVVNLFSNDVDLLGGDWDDRSLMLAFFSDTNSDVSVIVFSCAAEI